MVIVPWRWIDPRVDVAVFRALARPSSGELPRYSYRRLRGVARDSPPSGLRGARPYSSAPQYLQYFASRSWPSVAQVWQPVVVKGLPLRAWASSTVTMPVGTARMA